MNFLYLPTNFTSLPFYYWPYVPHEYFQPITSERPDQTRETYPEESSIKIQATVQNAEIKKTVSDLSQRRKSKKQKKKTKKSKKRDINFSSKTQKKNRNYPSILCKAFLFYLTQHPQPENIINPIVWKYKISFGAQKFYQQFHSIFDLKANYVRKESIQKVLTSENCCEEFSLIFRILFRNFLKIQVFPTVFKSSKLNKKVKSKEAKFAREVYKSFFEGRSGDQNKKNVPILQIHKTSLQSEKQILKAQKDESFPI